MKWIILSFEIICLSRILRSKKLMLDYVLEFLYFRDSDVFCSMLSINKQYGIFETLVQNGRHVEKNCQFLQILGKQIVSNRSIQD